MIDFVKIHTGVDSGVIALENLEAFFSTEQSENTTLEFKSYNSVSGFEDQFKNIIRTVSAFLNSQGGLIVWGAPKEVEINKRKSCQGVLTTVDRKLSKDQFISKVLGNIVPTPVDVDVIMVGGDDVKRCVYLIQVQRSLYSPHQYNNQYWMRGDGQTLPAPHHFVEALFKQIRYPDLRGTLLFPRYQFIRPERMYWDEYYLKLQVDVKLENNSVFQNEENFEFDILCNNGHPLDFGDEWPINPHKPSAVYSARLSYQLKMLHHGNPVHGTYAIGYDARDLLRDNGKSNVVLRFGGRFSPLKYSIYQIEFPSIDHLRHIENNTYAFEQAKVSKNENLLVPDLPISPSELRRWKGLDV